LAGAEPASAAGFAASGCRLQPGEKTDPSSSERMKQRAVDVGTMDYAVPGLWAGSLFVTRIEIQLRLQQNPSPGRMGAAAPAGPRRARG
jgi:hypothetical protein